MRFLVLMSLGLSLVYGSIDINTANVSELSTLKGIGEKKAIAIVEYRKTNCFKNIEDIVSVKGIGEKFLEKNRTNLSASECK